MVKNDDNSSAPSNDHINATNKRIVLVITKKLFLLRETTINIFINGVATGYFLSVMLIVSRSFKTRINHVIYCYLKHETYFFVHARHDSCLHSHSY